MHIYHKLLHIGVHCSHGSAGDGRRGEGLTGPCGDYGSGMLWAVPRRLGTAPHAMSPCLYLTLRLSSQPNAETLENKIKGASKGTEHTHLTGGEVKAQSRGK